MCQQQNRREFVARVAAAACVTLPVLQNMIGSSSVASAADAPESVPTTPPSSPPSSPPATAPAVAVGWITAVKAADLKDGGFVDTFAKDHKFILSRVGDKIYALDTKCTHKACAVQTAPTDILCKCHNSHFSPDGTPTKGPAKTPLDRHPLRLTAAGVIEVDTSQKLTSKDDASVLALKATA